MNLTDDDKKWLESLVARSATKADLERVETKLLAEFHKSPSPVEARQRTHSANLHTIELEMELLSYRIKKLEGPRPS